MLQISFNARLASTHRCERGLREVQWLSKCSHLNVPCNKFLWDLISKTSLEGTVMYLANGLITDYIQFQA